METLGAQWTKRLLAACGGAVILLTGASAQTLTSGPPSASAALAWIQSEWRSVSREGRAAADRLVRRYPATFQSVRAQVSRVTRVVSQAADPQRLDEKRELLLELWRVRGSLDILALGSPDVVHQLTGLDTSAIASLQAQVSQLRKRLGG